MQVEEIVLPLEEAQKKYKEYLEAEKKHKKKYLTEMKKAYRQLAKGKGILDLYESLKKAGLNEKEQPKLAIVRADSPRVRFECSNWRDEVTYYRSENGSWKSDIKIPRNVLSKSTTTQYIQTPAPIIPANILNTIKDKLSNYHILWEVEIWEPVPSRDPILLKRITPNLFIIHATWDLTPLERAVIRGRIA